MDFSQIFVDNPNLFIMLFAGVLVMFLIVFIVIKVSQGKKKSQLRGQGNMAELVFDQTIRPVSQFVTDLQFMGYKVYSVNGIEPFITGKSIFVPAGSCAIELEYIDTDYATRRRSMTTLYGKERLTLKLQASKQYDISFNEKDGSFVVR